MPPLVQREDKPYVVVATVGEKDGNNGVPKSNMSSQSTSNMATKNNEQRIKRRSVCFDEDVISFAPQHLQVDRSSKSDTWYEAADYLLFKLECKRTLKHMIKKIREERGIPASTDSSSSSDKQPTSSPEDEEEYCSIGLENFIPSKLRAKNERRYLLTDIILECQEEIKEEATLSSAVDNGNKRSTPEEYLASRSRHETAKSRVEAQTRGEQLAVEVYQMNWKEMSSNNEDSRQRLVSLWSNRKSRAKETLNNVRANFMLPILKVVSKVAEALWTR